jgi:hypothetical protein
MELLGGQECRVKMISLRCFSTPLVPYPAPQCQPSASESSVVQRSSLWGGHYRGLRMPEGVVEKQPDRAAVWTFQEA